MVRQSGVWQVLVKHYPVDLANLIEEYIAPVHDYILLELFEEKFDTNAVIRGVANEAAALQLTISNITNFVEIWYVDKDIAMYYGVTTAPWMLLDSCTRLDELPYEQQVVVWQDMYNKYYQRPELLWEKWSNVPAELHVDDNYIERLDSPLIRKLLTTGLYRGPPLEQADEI